MLAYAHDRSIVFFPRSNVVSMAASVFLSSFISELPIILILEPIFAIMKLSLYTGTFALVAATAAAANSLFSFHPQRELPAMDATAALDHARRLEIDEFLSFFLVSGIDENVAWCITAAEGTEEFGNLKLQPCDFEGAPANQRWFPSFDSVEGGEGDFKIRSSLDDSKCITVNHGTKIFNGARTRLSDCDNGLNVFYGDGHIHVSDDDSFCLTNRGPRPHADDWIHVKPCLDRKDFFWEPQPYFDFEFRIQMQSGGGCAQPREGSRRVFLDECNEDLAWRLSFESEEEHALLHSALDDDMCLRAGLGDTMGDGTRMALVACDPEDPLQQFIYTGATIHAAYDFELCMVYRGTSPHVGVDPIIMKTCADHQEEWQVIDIFPFEI